MKYIKAYEYIERQKFKFSKPKLKKYLLVNDKTNLDKFYIVLFLDYEDNYILTKKLYSYKKSDNTLKKVKYQYYTIYPDRVNFDIKFQSNVLQNILDIVQKNNENIESERYLSDEDIEAGYEKYTITDFKVEKLYSDGGASGYIEILFSPDDEENSNYKFDNWIKYDFNLRIAFDNWYPNKINSELKEYIEEGIKKEILKRDSEKYNL